MSMTLMVKAMQVKTGSAQRKLVLIKLADNASDSGECWPSYQHIADHCEMDRRTVIRHIKALSEMGMVKIERRAGEKGNSSNVFRVVIPSDPVSPPSDSLTLPSDPMTPPPSDTVSPRTSHSFESVNEPLDHSANKKDSAKQELIADTFEHWWKLYPTKTGKIKAASIWNNICKKKTEDQIADLTDEISVNIVDQIEKEVFGFDRLHPTTYLNQERWNDELPC